VRGDVGEIEEKRLLRLRDRLFDKLQRAVGEVVGDVEVVRWIDDLPAVFELELGADFQGFLEIDAAAGRSAPEAVEAAVERLVAGAGADVPLAGHERRVSGGFENLGEGGGAAVQLPLIAGETGGRGHRTDARLVRIEPG